MLGVGWTEMLLIGVVALIVIGPKELPALMNRIGKFAGTVRRMGSDFQRELNKTTGLNEITNLRNSVTAPLKATADAIRKEFNTTTPTGQVQPSGALKPADPTAESVVDEIKAAAGIAPAAAAPAMTPLATPQAAPVKTGAAEPSKPPVKATRPARIKAPAESKVVAADIPPVKKSAPKGKTVAASASPAEAPARATKPAAKKPAAKKAPVKVAEATAQAEPAKAKPATTRARKPASAAKKS